MHTNTKAKELQEPCTGTIAFVGLGSNLGDRLEMLRRALCELDAHSDVRVDSSNGVAPLYRTSPVGDGRETNADHEEEQPHFFNSAVRVLTTRSARGLLEVLLAVEASIGRTRTKRWQARTIDLDLLLFGDSIVRDAALTVPHPRLAQRRFVLEPLSEIAGDVVHDIARGDGIDIDVERF